MNLKKNLVLGLLLLFSIFWASAALASSISIRFSVQAITEGPPPFYWNINSDPGDPPDPHVYNLDWTPPFAGVFKLPDIACNIGNSDGYYVPHIGAFWPSDYGSEITFGMVLKVDVQYTINQDGPLLIAGANWSATGTACSRTESSEINFPINLYGNADPDLVRKGGDVVASSGGPTEVFNTFVTAPLNWEDWPDPQIEGSHNWGAESWASLAFQGVLSQTIAVIDTSAPAPLPPSIVLLGSGLLGLGFYGRRKLICRK